MTPVVSVKSVQKPRLNKKFVDDTKSESRKTSAALESSVAKAMPAGLRREHIVKTLLSLMSERSPGEISTQLIADTAGVSQATIFRHFSTKADLWASTAHWLGEELDKIWIRSRTEVAPDRALLVLEEIFLGVVDFFVQYPAVVRMMMSDCLRHEFADVLEISQMLHQRYQQEIGWLLELAIKAKMANSALDCKAAATMFLYCIRGLGFQIAMSGSSSSLRKESNQVLQLYFHAIGGHCNR